ncbi:hypothetical protein ACFWOS_05435 [Streptomyces rubiginosohelvolus]|uniref:hypothetical protein n=1 Tax=Streptomyces rubiginosohelvolus TaxID=67362 RepID=UPI0036473912
MLAMVIGVLVFCLGICLVGNFRGLANWMLEHTSSLINVGGASVNTFRLVGVVAIVVGFFWVATSLPEIL